MSHKLCVIKIKFEFEIVYL